MRLSELIKKLEEAREKFGDREIPFVNENEETFSSASKFYRVLPARFDGLFAWDWINATLGPPQMRLSDIDGAFERNDYHLMFETKDAGVRTPNGQLLRNKSLVRVGGGKIIFIDLEGKTKEEFRSMSVWYYNDSVPGKVSEWKPEKNNTQALLDYTSEWFRRADQIKRLPK